MFSPGVGTKDARRSSRGKTAPAVTKGPLEGERSDFLFFRLSGAVKKGFFFYCFSQGDGSIRSNLLPSMAKNIEGRGGGVG